jgi:Leucine-rich repeat (LRR) protein
MCLICLHKNNIDLIVNIKKLHCFECKHVQTIPKELTKLEYLYCNNTNVKDIPSELTLLKKLNVNGTKIKTFPNTLINLEILYCNDTLIENIPDNFPKLKEFHCERSNIKYINNESIDKINVIDCFDLMAINTKYKKIYGLETCISMIDLKKIKEEKSEINKAIIEEMYSPERIKNFILKNKDFEDLYLENMYN